MVEAPAAGIAQRGKTQAVARLFGSSLVDRLALVENAQHDVAHRLVGEVLLSVNGAARNVVALTGLEHDRRLSLDGEGDLALLDRGPLIAGMTMEMIVGAGWRGDGLHIDFARRIVL